MIFDSALLLQIGTAATRPRPKNLKFVRDSTQLLRQIFHTVKQFHKKKNVTRGKKFALVTRFASSAVSIQPPASRPLRTAPPEYFYPAGAGRRLSLPRSRPSPPVLTEITGLVRNLPDGRVELVREGNHEELEAFRTAIPDEGLAGFISRRQLIWPSRK